jgi:hypothetical protein
MIRVYIALAVVAVYSLLIWDYAGLRQDNKDLKGKIETAQRSIKAQNEILMGMKKIQTNERELIDEIARAPAGDDAPTAPVLLNAIARLHAADKK